MSVAQSNLILPVGAIAPGKIISPYPSKIETPFAYLDDPGIQGMALERLEGELGGNFPSLRKILDDSADEEVKKKKVHSYYGSFLTSFLAPLPMQVLSMVNRIGIKLVPGTDIKDPSAVFVDILTKLRSVNTIKNLSDGVVYVKGEK